MSGPSKPYIEFTSQASEWHVEPGPAINIESPTYWFSISLTPADIGAIADVLLAWLAANDLPFPQEVGHIDSTPTWPWRFQTREDHEDAIGARMNGGDAA